MKEKKNITPRFVRLKGVKLAKERERERERERGGEKKNRYIQPSVE